MNRLIARTLLHAFMIAGLTTGCTYYQGGVVHRRDASQFSNAHTAGGVQIGATAVVSKVQSMEIFDAYLGGKGYFPVEVFVKNQTDSRILLERDRVELVSNSGETVRPVPLANMIADFERSMVAYSFLGSAGILSAAQANKKMAADWSAKEFPHRTIVPPSGSSSGFIYFKLPEGEGPEGRELVIPAEKLESRTTEVFRLRL